MKKPAPSGLILLHKQPGVTSFDALRDIKRTLGTGSVGHTGTLDKFAGGLLLVLTGRALKLSRWFTHCDKQYEGTVRFGSETDTLDPEGRVIAEAPTPSRDQVETALAQFRGEIEQAPPAYSAIHIEGERASALARQGKAPEMQKRPVTIHCLELRSWEPPFATLFVHCSSGTYIRSLARDIALAAGSRAYLTALLRTKVAGFGLEEAIIGSGEWGVGSGEEGVTSELPVFNPKAMSCFEQRSPLPINKAIFDKLGLSCMEIAPEDVQKVIHGKPLAQIMNNTSLLPGKNTAVALFSGDSFVAIIEWIDNKWNYGYVFARD